MKSLLPTVLGLACLVVCASTASAARLMSVVPSPPGSACVQGPNGVSVQFWEVEPGKTYELLIDQVTDCGNGGTDPTIGFRLNSSSAGNTDWVGTKQSTGVYKVTVTLPAGAVCTMPLFYCTTPGMSNTGTLVQRNDGESFQAHLRMASFGPACSNPVGVGGADCSSVPARSRTWAQVKQFYR